jgi:hypothetical protein
MDVIGTFMYNNPAVIPNKLTRFKQNLTLVHHCMVILRIPHSVSTESASPEKGLTSVKIVIKY